jgi:phosphoribosylaminoimidazole-succinocarboxamide synthase
MPGTGSGSPATLDNGWQHAYSGKVRDLYTSPEHPDRVLMVASDRVSAYDHLLEPPIPHKGELLTRLSLWWFGHLTGVANHLVTPAETSTLTPSSVADRSMLVKSLTMYPIECVVRGYLSGSGWVEYQQSQSVCGIALPAGLSDGDRLPEPIFTPAWKAPMGEHDENISFERAGEIVGVDVATALRDASLSIFATASAIAEARGVILADTKFEFGDDAGVLTLGDEVLTSDSSRYWDAELYATGDRTASFDKQIVRDWLKANWDMEGIPPTLPQEIVAQTALRYRELIERLTGE